MRPRQNSIIFIFTINSRVKVTCSIRFIILCSTVLKQNMQNFSEVTRKYHQIEEVEWLPSKKFKLFYWDFNLKVVKFYFEKHFCCSRYKTQVTAHRSRTQVTGHTSCCSKSKRNGESYTLYWNLKSSSSRLDAWRPRNETLSSLHAKELGTRL